MVGDQAVQPLAEARPEVDAVRLVLPLEPRAPDAEDGAAAPGQGVEGIVDGRCYRLGRSDFAANRSDDGELWLGENGQPIALPGKPGDPPPEKRFQFPDILSGKTDGTTTNAKPAAETGKPADAAKAPEAPSGFYLMAGSFQKPSDAEAQKANLALIGFDATVQKAVIGEKVWYRVKIGPFKRQDDANRARNELKENGIDAVSARN